MKMSLKKCGAVSCMFLLILTTSAALKGHTVATPGEPVLNPQAPPQIEFITAEELKSKLAKSQPVTIIDVRSTSGLLDNDNKIKGSFHVKLRRLKSRLAFPPLKDIPRDREIVTYCACPNDESSIHAAQMLLDAGFKRVRALKGGWIGWQKAKGPIESMATGM
jgi:rhodanese-related sulfurtransferase